MPALKCLYAATDRSRTRTAALCVTLLVLVAVASCGDDDAAVPGPPPGGNAPSENPATAVTILIPIGASGMGAAAYGQNPLVVPAGTLVTWINRDSMTHSATALSGAFDSGPLGEGQSFSFTFNTPGAFPYFCTIHGQQSMSGAIEVQAPATPTPSPFSSP